MRSLICLILLLPALARAEDDFDSRARVAASNAYRNEYNKWFAIHSAHFIKGRQVFLAKTYAYAAKRSGLASELSCEYVKLEATIDTMRWSFRETSNLIPLSQMPSAEPYDLRRCRFDLRNGEKCEASRYREQTNITCYAANGQ